jgi:UDP-N-acetylmuramoylalanine--D-glutamate ligase
MKIAIAGYGLEGKANLIYFRGKFPEATFTIFDNNAELEDAPGDVETVLGEDAFKKIQDFDLVVRTAGLAPRKIGQADKHWSSTREFFAECPAPIIGVTGSKGKGTTSSFIAEILGAAGKTVHLLGNIGVPALSELPKIKASDFVVYELSSFQLWDLELSPGVAVMTLIEPDHLDVHENFADYVATKANIFAYQKAGDVAVYNESDSLVREMVEDITRRTGADKIPFLNKKFVHVEQGRFYYGHSEICPTDAVELPGEHNLRNAVAAISATWEIIKGDRKAVESGLKNFHGLPHRLKFVRQFDGVKFYDDSFATTPGSAIAAVKAFDQPKILIVGGHDKGANYRLLGQVIEQSNVRAVFAIGENRSKIANQVGEKTDAPIHLLDSRKMTEIVKIVSQASEPGDLVIMSPAAASFDMFRDYKDRGEQFIAAVKNL